MMRVLILTDHSTHTDSNSFYGIAGALALHPSIEVVFAASRGDNRNRDFFEHRRSDTLFGIKVDGKINLLSFAHGIQKSKEIRIQSFDFIFLRLPRPVSLDFFSFLVSLFPEKNIVNRPSGIIKTGSKAYLLNFPNYTPPVRLCYTEREILEFAAKFPIVLKPLEEYGGKGLIRMEGETVWLGSDKVTINEFLATYKEGPIPYLAMKFLKNVTQGDKRLVIANGRILAATLRTPAPGSWLCNVAQGGSASIDQPSHRELEIVSAIHPELTEEGIFLYGLDTLVDDNGVRVISEINTLSVGGIMPSELETGLPLSRMLAEEFVNFVSKIGK